MLFTFEKIKIFNTFKGLPLLDGRIEKLAEFLKIKYNIDYLGVQGIDKDFECLYTVRGDSKLHEFATKHKFVYHCKAVQKLINLNQNENCVMFFSTYANSKIKQQLEIRAEIIGIKKNGFSVLLQSPETKNKVMFCITFADNMTIDQLDRKVFFKLVNHLQKATVILDPFLLWFRNIGNLIYTPAMEKSINKTEFFLPFE